MRHADLKEVLDAPGNPAAIFRIQRNVGQWLCAPPFWMVYLFQGLTFLSRSLISSSRQLIYLSEPTSKNLNLLLFDAFFHPNHSFPNSRPLA
jgi:hypothetical protein